jgi:hypothetical protein
MEMQEQVGLHYNAHTADLCNKLERFPSSG